MYHNEALTECQITTVKLLPVCQLTTVQPYKNANLLWRLPQPYQNANLLCRLPQPYQNANLLQLGLTRMPIHHSSSLPLWQLTTVQPYTKAKLTFLNWHSPTRIPTYYSTSLPDCQSTTVHPYHYANLIQFSLIIMHIYQCAFLPHYPNFIVSPEIHKHKTLATFGLGSNLQLLVANWKKFPCECHWQRGYLALAMANRLG